MILAGLLLAANAVAGERPGAENFLHASLPGKHVDLTVSLMQPVIEAEGLSFIRIQHVDKGLSAKGFDRPPYKLVFFGDRKVFQRARELDPRITPYLPFKITIYQGPNGNTHLSVMDPSVVGRMFNPRVQPLFREWSRTFQRILERTVERVKARSLPPAQGS
jgi:uncharacterized protein (DUF302 family)